MGISSRRALVILFGIILVISGVAFFFGIPDFFGVKNKPSNLLGIIFLVGGGIITFFAALNEATEFIQRVFSKENKVLPRREKPYNIHGPSNLQNHLNLISVVRDAWIKGVYENNLQEAVKLELDLKDNSELLLRPNLHLRYQYHEELVIQPGTPIRQIFQESGQALLILGAPGSGKTFTMLELARDLLDEAENDEQKPIPVVLNLSSWAMEQPLLEHWIIDEIHLQYQVAKKVSSAWLENYLLCILLDGLDEVARDHRDACVGAINTFKLSNNAPIVVCSRSEDYNILESRLNLSRAIEIQPLTNAQVNDYLSHPELQLLAMRAVLRHDPELRELTTSPLVLNVMTLAYRGLRIEELGNLGTKEARRYHLFNTYARRLFQRRPLLESNPYSTLSALSWLTFLAKQLIQRAQITFFLERMQVDWLLGADAHDYNREVQLVFGLILGLIFGLIFGAISGLAFVPANGLGVALLVWLFMGPILGFFLGSLLGSNLVKLHKMILPVDQLRFRRPSLGDLVSMAFLGLFEWLVMSQIVGDVSGLIIGLVTVMIYFFAKYLVPVESQYRTQPNQGIHRSLQNALSIILFYGFTLGLVFGLNLGLAFGLYVGLIVGIAFTFLRRDSSQAGNAVIQHYIIRMVLNRRQLLPLKLVPFLDAMTDRLFLYRVGGGYIFIHRTLMEHFASLSEDELKELAAQIEG